MMMLVATSPYDPEPGAASQRARGHVAASFANADGTTRIAALHQSGSCKLRLPRTYGSGREAILINTSGGLTGGDQLTTVIDVGAGAEMTVSTQACERAYRSNEGPAKVKTELVVGTGGRLDWLPQETILFDGSRLKRTCHIDLDEGAELLAIESVVLGRTAMGEVVRDGSFHERWRVRKGGRLVHADDIRLDGDIDSLAAAAATMGGAIALATILFVSAVADRFIDSVRNALGDTGGASAIEGKLIARVTAGGSYDLRRRVIPALAALRGTRPLPKAWMQ